MTKTRRTFAGVGLLALAGCGGDGGGAPTIPAPPVAVPAPPATPAVAPPVIVTGGPNDTAEYRASPGTVQANAVVAYNAGFTGRGVTAAIIDGGIDTASAAFAGRISAASTFTAGNGTIQDQGGHGTAVTAVLGAARDGQGIQGIAPEANLLVIRSDTPGTCDREDGCSHDDDALARGVDIAVANRARVINMSLGGSPANGALQAAIGRATAAGVVVVISAGNEGRAQPDSFALIATDPAVARGLVVIAGATDASGDLASFSNRAGAGATFYLAALGDRVPSFDQTGATFLFSGTSFSAPLISGAATLLAQAFPALSGAQIVDLLYSTADDLGSLGADATYGRGRLNLARAFQPRGPTALPGSAIPVSLALNGIASAPMGDAVSRAGAGTIILDGYGRAYALDLGGTLATGGLARRLGPALASGGHSLAMAAGGTLIDVSVAEARPIGSPAYLVRPRVTSGLVRGQIGATMLAMSVGRRSSELIRTGDPFLVADAADAPGFATAPGLALALRRTVGGWEIALRSEAGRALAPQLVGRGIGDARYNAFGVTLDRRLGLLTASLGWSRLSEAESLLGARLGPVFGRGAQSRFIDSGVALDLAGWTFEGHWRHGWSAAGGTTIARGRLVTDAFALGASTAGIVAAGDRLGLRVAQPLRVTRGGFALDLPTGYDYAAGVTSTTRQQLALAPTGRELDLEGSYARPFAGGWLAANLYWRRQPGHDARRDADLGAALRWRAAF